MDEIQQPKPESRHEGRCFRTRLRGCEGGELDEGESKQKGDERVKRR